MRRELTFTVMLTGFMLLSRASSAFEDETYEQSRMSSDYMAKMMGGKQFGRGKDEKDPAVKTDLKYIICGTCEGIAKQAVLSVKRNKSEETPIKKYRESDVLDMLEEICDPDTAAGEWITNIDLQETGDRLQLVEMPQSGKCRRECRTIARACSDIMEDADITELSEGLWHGFSRGDTSKLLCKELTSSCKRKIPPLPKDRPVGEEFQPLTEDELSMRQTMRGMKKSGMSGTMYDRNQILDKMGGMGAMSKYFGSGDEDEDEDSMEEMLKEMQGQAGVTQEDQDQQMADYEKWQDEMKAARRHEEGGKWKDDL
ncbi:hypothetical protein CEUSTIGMA_g9512.t1 [Chlamydomonas eustigma]|uniref:Saposin B-type domain-containing protein n=1 Tax=Chlamydomonas eustigma TaxID=1157962 RepID=A0A250XG76_9CHLO|nr:hypothetical protein CEUSTIGMA_g9512.t1 [Chlamydomonas eustigma]|eukprot:GAX82084.1 hypothetical protein CEUSTIGMA_g9512.t1 [Chlamydomonas eustigma]